MNTLIIFVMHIKIIDQTLIKKDEIADVLY